MTAETSDPSKTPSTPGLRLKHSRVKAGMNQARLAIEAGTTMMHIIDLENGHHEFEGKLTRLAAALDVNPQWIETGKGPMKADPNAEPAPAVSEVPVAHSQFAAEGKAHGAASLIVALGDEMERLSAPARSRMNGILARLAEQPHTRHDLATEASHILRTGARAT